MTKDGGQGTLAQVRAFCDWQAYRLRLRLGNMAPVVQCVPSSVRTVSDWHRPRPRPNRGHGRALHRGPYVRRYSHGTVARDNHGGTTREGSA